MGTLKHGGLSARKYADTNRRAWDYLAAVNSSASQPWPEATAEEYRAWVDEFGWLPWSELGDVLLLCGAGGQQGPVFASLGLNVTVVDLSDGQLAIDRRVAAQRGLRIETVSADAQDPSLLAGRQFDLVYQPVSTCYLPNPRLVYANVARLVKPGGWYLSDHWNPAQIQLSTGVRWDGSAYRVARPSGGRRPLRVVDPSTSDGPDCMYFAHRLRDLVGGICDAGFVIERFGERGVADPAAEPDTTDHLGAYLAPFYEVLARRSGVTPTARRPAAATYKGRANGTRRASRPVAGRARGGSASYDLQQPLVGKPFERTDLLDRWQRNGFVILRHSLAETWVTGLRKESATQRACASRSSWAGHALSDDGDYVSGTMDFHSAQPGPLLSRLHRHPSIQRLMRAITGWPRISANENIAFMYYDRDSSIDLHTDVPECQVTALTAIRGHVPPLVAYPRLRGLTPQQLLAVAERTGGRPRGGVQLEVPVGGLLVIDGRRLPHRRPPLPRGHGPCTIAALCFADPARRDG